MMQNKFQQLDDDSALSLGSCILKTNYFLSYISEFLKSQQWEIIRNNLYSAGLGLVPNVGSNLFNEGVSCEVLKTGKNWQKGKVKIKISLEFQPDEPEIEVIENSNSESSLDDIRRKLNQAN